MIARILWELRGGTPGDALGVELMRQAARIAVNRTVAGVHFPVDTVAGQMLGLTLARYFVRRAKGNTGFRAWRFDGERYPRWPGFRLQRSLQHQHRAAEVGLRTSIPCRRSRPKVSPILRWLWTEAENEWV